MSKIITVINMKGGVGKTTLSVNFSYVLSRYHKKKVLVVDIDPQFNATQYLVEQSRILQHFENKKTIYEILVPDKEEEISLSAKKKTKVVKIEKLNDYIIPIKKFSHGGQLDLIPSSLRLINFEQSARGVEYRLKNFLSEKCKHYDIVVIDCPPTLSLLTLSAFLASEFYLVPIKPDYLSSLGLPLLERGLDEYRETFNHNLDLLGIVFTMVNNTTTVSTEIMQSIAKDGWECFKYYSSQSVQVARSVKSLDKFYNSSTYERYAGEFLLITKEILAKI